MKSCTSTFASPPKTFTRPGGPSIVCACPSGPIPVRILRAAQFHAFFVEVAKLLLARCSDPARIEGVSGFYGLADPDRKIYESGALMPGPEATLAGPTFEEWLDSTS